MTRSRLSRTVLSTAAVLGTGLALAGAAHAAPLTNGSFEQPGGVPEGDGFTSTRGTTTSAAGR